MQISTDQWAVIRESLDHPKSIIRQVTARDQTQHSADYTACSKRSKKPPGKCGRATRAPKHRACQTKCDSLDRHSLRK